MSFHWLRTTQRLSIRSHLSFDGNNDTISTLTIVTRDAATGCGPQVPLLLCSRRYRPLAPECPDPGDQASLRFPACLQKDPDEPTAVRGSRGTLSSGHPIISSRSPGHALCPRRSPDGALPAVWCPSPGLGAHRTNRPLSLAGMACWHPHAPGRPLGHPLGAEQGPNHEWNTHED